MSALFIWMFFERPDQRGLSLVGAHVFLPLMNPEIERWSFLTFLCVTILLLDLVYVALLHDARRKRQGAVNLLSRPGLI